MPERRITVFSGADIVTMDAFRMAEKRPRAEAACVANGRIAAVGSRGDMLSLASGMGSFEEVSFGGGVIYPGFIDSHSHLSSYSACLDRVYCGASLGSVAAVLEALRAKASSSRDEWVIGYGYDDSGMADRRHLTRADLDAACADRPVFVMHISMHLGYANTLALQKLGFDKAPRIDGGEVCLGADSMPNGLVLENACFAAFKKLPSPGPEQVRANLLRAVAEYNRQGFTSFIDGAVGLNGDADVLLGAYFDLARSGRLNARAYLQLLPAELDKAMERGLMNAATDHCRIGGAKFFADGSIQGFTAALLEGYHARPGFRGSLILPPEEIERTILKYHGQGIQVAVHANGDAAIEAVIRGFEKAVRTVPRTDLRHMLVHAQTASDQQLKRMKACGVIPTLFAQHIEVWGDRHATIYLGPQRASRLDPAGSCVRLGMPFSLHVDTPVLPPTALGCMHAAVNRVSSGGLLLGAEQRISAREALRAYTSYASLCCGGEGDRGRIAPGMLADFTVLDRDLEKVEPAEIKYIRVLATVCGGRVVYAA